MWGVSEIIDSLNEPFSPLESGCVFSDRVIDPWILSTYCYFYVWYISVHRPLASVARMFCNYISNCEGTEQLPVLYLFFSWLFPPWHFYRVLCPEKLKKVHRTFLSYAWQKKHPTEGYPSGRCPILIYTIFVTVQYLHSYTIFFLFVALSLVIARARDALDM